MRLVTDTFAYCAAELPAWNTISISGYHMREAGSTAVQEVAFTIANAIAYADAAIAAGLRFDDFAPRLSFFFAAHNDLFEEAAKFRVARRVWAKVARDRFGAADERSMTMRFLARRPGLAARLLAGLATLVVGLRYYRSVRRALALARAVRVAAG